MALFATEQNSSLGRSWVLKKKKTEPKGASLWGGVVFYDSVIVT